MFFDVVDMTTAYIQYITLLLNLSPESLPSFYREPFVVIRYAVFDSYRKVEEVQRYNNPLRVDLPDWLPLDIRLQYVCVAVIGPLALSTVGLLLVYGKPAYLWFVCLLSTLFMFLFGFIVLANMADLTFPGSSLPPKSTLSSLGGVGLPLFVLLLAVGLVSMGRARLRHLRRDAVELEKLIDEERQRRESLPITQQLVDRQGIDLVAVAAERVHAKRREYRITHLDAEDVLWQGAFVLVLLMGSLVLLGAIPIPAMHYMQQSIVFKVLGSITAVLFAFATVWWTMSLFTKGRQYLYVCSTAFDLRALSLIMVVASLLYISVVTHFISIVYCMPLTCEAGSRMPHSASLFPPLSYATDGNNISDDLSVARCLSCDFHSYPQKCSTALQENLCATSHQQSRLVYDTRVPCDSMDGFYIASGILVFTFYILFLPYLQFYVAQYGVRMLQDAYPLEQRYHDVFTPEELYLQKVLFSDNSAAFAYRAYKPQFRFYRLSFLLQKIILGVVGCVMQRGQQRRIAWVGMLFFLVVPLIALSCAVYLQPFSRPTEAIYFPSLQAMVSVCSLVFLAAWHFGSAAVPLAVWIILPLALVGVPAITLGVGTVLSLREERRWSDMLEKRLAQGVTVTYARPGASVQQAQSSNPPQPKPRVGLVAGIMEAATRNSDAGVGDSDTKQQPSRETRDAKKPAEDSDGEELWQCGPGDGSRSLITFSDRPLASAAAAGVAAATDARVAALPQHDNPDSDLLSRTSAAMTLSPAFLTARHQKPGAEKSPSRLPASSSPMEYARCPSLSRDKTTLAPTFLPSTPTTLSTHTSIRTQSARTRQGLSALLQARTWWGSLKAFSLIAVETVAAPFLLFRHRNQLHCHDVGRDDKRGDEMVSIRGSDWGASMPAAVGPCAEPKGQQQRRSVIVGKPSLIVSLASLFQCAGRSSAANPAVVNTGHRGSSASSDQPTGCASEKKPGRRRRASLQPHQQSATHSTKAAREDAGSGAAGALRDSLPALAPPAVANTAPAWPASGRQRRRHSASFLVSSFCAQLVQLWPGQPPRAVDNRVGVTAGEYAREATVVFVPSLFFAPHTPATWRFAKVLSRIHHPGGHRRWSSKGDANAARAPHSAATARPFSSSLTSALVDVPLPRKRTSLGEEGSEAYSLPPWVPIWPHLSPSDPVPTVSPSLPRHLDDRPSGGTANHDDGSARSSGCRVVPSRLQQVIRKMMRCLSCSLVRGPRATDRSSGGNGGVGEVLSFAEVYARRQACARDVTQSGLERLCTAQELQRHRHKRFRKAFWGNPTDAMFGVVDVPGSMPPWSLFCNVSLPPVTPTALPTTAQRQPQQRTMASLQNQYYAQLVEEQQDADMPKKSGGTISNRSASLGTERGTGAAAVRYRKRGVAAESNSPLRSMTCASLSAAMNLNFSLPVHPVRAAARERQAAAVLLQQERSQGTVPVSLDTEMREPDPGKKRGGYKGSSGELNVEDVHYDGCRNGVSVDLDDSLLSSEAGCGQSARLAGTLHWLEKWGPVLTELLYETAKDDEKHVATEKRRTSGTTDSSASSDTRGNGSSPSTDAAARVRPDAWDTESQQQRRSKWARKGWLMRLLPSNWGSTSSKSARPRGGDKAGHQKRSFNSDDQVSRRSGAHHKPPPPPSLSSMRRQPSMLLSLMTGNVYCQTSKSGTLSEASVAGSATRAPQAAVPEIVPGNSRRSSSPFSVFGANSSSSSSSGEGAAWPYRQYPTTLHTPNGDWLNKAEPAVVTKRLNPASQPHSNSAIPTDPLIQQLRSLYLLRERLKESYWEHREQLKAVQSYIDYEINEAVRRVLSFLFMVLGVVATIALVLALCGMLHTLDWAFINGVQRSNGALRYELAGYSSWDNFTHNCCCMAATDAAARYPYYALDVENWVCANGITKERVRRDGYDDLITDGYAVRALCGMEFKNNCMVVVDQGVATLKGCDAAVVSEKAMQRW
ncbi:hypothetical protein LBRM_10_1030 [Leishmania braziliensis MHOM/BR/75/M2904]|uniref:Uncharacterized protein n=2 Tax=Leishmania braziliensis TaxID=5660 RepID=A4H681_LEIBR|nr:hypothetical protein LBRM_10_1030 [Leishmania braziliensis MHOM/BR/75/M2904]CAJ2467899.1 unnamed protein product [Leishmania braziliensis]CAM37304.2 hypothetical protein LBRM_10_1030 [Leishmania braziliensis MHOM/BR/75/M2904]SYZ63507.1 hypothetical_protein [Leishmania braziliensis MHOM/BR/75/M2904]